jgi:hypothetical protein
MSVFWKIKLDDGRDGYQVMDDNLSNAQLIDDQCNLLEGSFGYSFVEVATAPACWVSNVE